RTTRRSVAARHALLDQRREAALFATAQVRPPALRALHQLPELALLVLRQVLVEALTALAEEPPGHVPRDPPADAGEAGGESRDGHAPNRPSRGRQAPGDLGAQELGSVGERELPVEKGELGAVALGRLPLSLGLGGRELVDLRRLGVAVAVEAERPPARHAVPRRVG